MLILSFSIQLAEKISNPSRVALLAYPLSISTKLTSTLHLSLTVFVRDEGTNSLKYYYPDCYSLGFVCRINAAQIPR